MFKRDNHRTLKQTEPNMLKRNTHLLLHQQKQFLTVIHLLLHPQKQFLTDFHLPIVIKHIVIRHKKKKSILHNFKR